MNRVVLIVAIFISSIFAADTLYLKDGQEIKDATVLEIGVSEVKYKVGKKTVIYTTRKSDIAIIFYSDGTKETFADSESSKSENPLILNVNQNNNQNVNQNANAGGQQSQPYLQNKPLYDNFSTGQRWATWGLNLIPGLGSLLIMSDWTGAIVQWVLYGGGYALMIAGMDTREDCYSGYYSTYCDEIEEFSGVSYVGAVAVVGYFVYNIYRSASYDKPNSVAYGKHEGFNFAVMPNRHGNFMPAVTYSIAF